jgi:hypothetical protein
MVYNPEVVSGRKYLTLPALMDYHIILVDYQARLEWLCKVEDHYELSTKRKKGGLLQAITKRVFGKPAFLNDVSDVRRSIMRFDERVGVVVYHVRLSCVRSCAIVVVFFRSSSR